MSNIDPQLQQHALSSFHREIDAWVGMPVSEWQAMLPYLEVMQVPAKQLLQTIGRPVDTFHFIYQGLVRYYYLDDQGREMNKAFYKENWPVGNLSAVIMNEPSRFNIATLEPSTLVRYSFRQTQAMMPANPSWQRLFDRSCQLMLVRNERREAELLSCSTRERYLQFIKNFPDLCQRIPQYHIASYLGITPVALSKYKKQWLQQPNQPKPNGS